MSLGLTAVVTVPAVPGSALVFTQQCDQSGGCMNFWGSYYGLR